MRSNGHIKHIEYESNVQFGHSSHENFFNSIFVHIRRKSKNPAVWSFLEFLKVVPMGKIFPEILNLCEVRKFCDDPASRSANWNQVNKIFSQFQRNLSISKISLKLREYFVHLVPVCGPGSWVIAKFSQFTQIEDFRKNFTHGELLMCCRITSHVPLPKIFWVEKSRGCFVVWND